MRHVLSLFIAIVLFYTLPGCKRKDPETIPSGMAGKGGNAILKITPKHHNAVIDSCTVYIKYNSQDVAVSYDDSATVVTDNNVSAATFSGLKTGNYYLYGKGWDSNINMQVIGGLPYIISEEKTLEIVVPVTEGD